MHRATTTDTMAEPVIEVSTNGPKLSPCYCLNLTAIGVLVMPSREVGCLKVQVSHEHSCVHLFKVIVKGFLIWSLSFRLLEQECTSRVSSSC